MAENNNSQSDNKTPKVSRDNLALIVGGIIVLGLAFAAYSYFNQNTSIQERIQRNAERVEDIISSNDERQGEEATDEGTEEGQEARNGGNGREIISNGGTTGGIGLVWTANDYQQGDIQSGNYTVVSGDTLWEIAEAVYGDGSQWTRILEANSPSIGMLPSGQQALIVPGQVLVLP